MSTRAYGAERPAVQPTVTTSYTVDGYLSAVTDVSPTEAWAVGYSGISSQQTLLLRWNGQKWSPVTTPKPVSGNLLGLTEISPSNILAVGFQATSSTASIPLVLHWNGRAWSRVPGTPKVNGVFAAIGDAGGTLLAAGDLNAPPMLLMERTGTRWKNLPVPSVAGALESLVVTGAKSAWAAGVTINTKTQVPNGDVLLHWNGRSWKSEPFPLHGTNENLWYLAAGPGGAVWAVGGSYNKGGTTATPLSMLWNGSAWRKVAVSAPANSELIGTAFVHGGTAWAVGDSGGQNTLILRWTGTAWKQVASPSPLAHGNLLGAVSASSPSDAWAVGGGAASANGTSKTIILHWNGSSWH